MALAHVSQLLYRAGRQMFVDPRDLWWVAPPEYKARRLRLALQVARHRTQESVLYRGCFGTSL